MTSEEQRKHISHAGDSLPTGEIREDEASGMFFLHVDAEDPDHPLEKKAIMWSRKTVSVKR